VISKAGYQYPNVLFNVCIIQSMFRNLPPWKSLFLVWTSLQDYMQVTLVWNVVVQFLFLEYSKSA